MKPQTYMIERSIFRPYLRRETWSAENDWLIIVDEVALPVGRFRLPRREESGGHNGLKSIEGAVGGQDYARPEDRRRSGSRIATQMVTRGLCARSNGKGGRKEVESLLPDIVTLSETWVRMGSEWR